MVDVILRPPHVGDGPGLAVAWLDLARHYAALAPDMFHEPSSEGLARWCEEAWALSASPDTDFVLVAEQDGQVVGFVTATLHPPLDDAAYQVMRDLCCPRLTINSLAVRQTHWRQGIGTRLMDAAEAWGRAQGAEVALLETYVDGPLSVPFYERRRGYRRRILHFRKALT